MAAGCLSLVSWGFFGPKKYLLFLFSFPTLSLAALLFLILIFVWQDILTEVLLHFLTSFVTMKNPTDSQLQQILKRCIICGVPPFLQDS